HGGNLCPLRRADSGGRSDPRTGCTLGLRARASPPPSLWRAGHVRHFATNEAPPMITDPLQRLSNLLSRLPGIGEKTALRYALAIARNDTEYTEALAQAVTDVQTTLRLCSICCDLAASEVCPICADPKRDPKTVAVVAHPQDR